MPSRAAAKRAPTQRLSAVDALARLSFLIQETLERRTAAHDLSIVHARLLGVLLDRRPNMNELARLLTLDKSSVTGLVDRAESRGLVTRVPSPTDRRATQVELTDAGRHLASEVATGFESDVAALLDPLSVADHTALTRIAGRLLAASAASDESV